MRNNEYARWFDVAHGMMGSQQENFYARSAQRYITTLKLLEKHLTLENHLNIAEVCPGLLAPMRPPSQSLPPLGFRGGPVGGQGNRI